MEFHSSTWPAEFVCPISQSVMADPVIVSSGQSYERRCIETWLDLGQTTCVKQNTPLIHDFIIPNIALRDAIANFAISKNMQVLPSPPSPRLARALAKHLISELHASNHFMQTSDLPQMDVRCISKQEDPCDQQSESLIGEVDAEREESVFNPDEEHIKSFRKEEMEGEGNMVHRFSRIGIGDEQHLELQKSSSSSHSMGYCQRNTATRGNMDIGHRQIDDVEAFKASRVRSGRAHYGDNRYARVARADGHLSSPIPSRYSHSASGEILFGTSYGPGELPPNLLTKPSSYSSSKEAPTPLVASSSSSCMTTSIIEKLRDPVLEVHEAAVTELRQLTRMSTENRVSLCCPDLIHALLPHLKSESSVVQIDGVAALVNLCSEKQNKVMIVRSGAVPYLVEVLKHGFPEAQEHAAGAVFSLALADENKDPIGVLNAIPPLVCLLHSSRPGAHQDAAMALYQLTLFQTNRRKLIKVGAVPILLNLAESKDRLDLASRVLLIICNVAAIPEGRATLLEHNAITKLVNLLAVRSNKHVPEQAAAALLLLSKGNRRFKTMALGAGAQELLTVLADVGTPRAREKALALLAIMKESSSGMDDLETDEMLSRQYLRRNKGRVDGGHINSSAF